MTDQEFNELRQAYRMEWWKACDYDEIDPHGKFIMFSPDNPYAKSGSKLQEITLAMLAEHKRRSGQNPMARQAARANPSGLQDAMYSSFHGANPGNARRVQVPAPQGHLVAIGKLVRIEYEPYGNSQHKNTRFFHVSGDTGDQKLKTNTILCTDDTGKNLFLIKDNPNSQYPYFGPRGIIG